MMDAAVYEALRLCDGTGLVECLPGGLDQYITKTPAGICFLSRKGRLLTT